MVFKEKNYTKIDSDIQKNRINIQKFIIIIPSLTKKTILTGVKFSKILAYMQVNVL